MRRMKTYGNFGIECIVLPVNLKINKKMMLSNPKNMHTK